jgi:hypothetical protein
MCLSFRLGPIPVRVHAWFLAMAVVLGLGAHHKLLGITI